MRAEFSILELVETADGVAIAAPVFARSEIQVAFAPRIGRGSQLPPERPHVHEIAVWC